MIQRLEKMLNQAKEGEWEEQSFDESRLSRLESGFADFFACQVLSKKRLEQEERKTKELIGDISHQTKTPIANILLYAQLLQEHELGEDERILAEQIVKQSEKLHFLIQSLVKISRLESGVFCLSPKKESISGLLLEAIEGIKNKAEKKGIQIDCQIPDDTLYAIFDWKWTIEAVQNVLDNAIKYTPTGGLIIVQTRAYELFTQIRIRDNGMGIAKEEMAQIFQRFYRSPSHAGEDGLGIGLYLTREILKGEGGYIKAESVKGEGSCFSLYLPN